jgi:hypothetical protein
MFGSGEPAPRQVEIRVASWQSDLSRTISPDRLREMVARYAGPHNRLHSPQEMKKTEDELVAELTGLGWRTERLPFRLTNAKGGRDSGPGDHCVYPSLDGVNVIAIKKGSKLDHKAIVLIAHYDTRQGTPGADDNTASVVALLEMARALRSTSFNSTVVLAFTDMEELAYLGARPLLGYLRSRFSLKAILVLETLAYTDDRPHTLKLESKPGRLYRHQWERMARKEWAADFLLVLYQRRSAHIAATFASALGTAEEGESYVLIRELADLPLLGPILRVIAPSMARQFRRSDHVPFWNAHIPAIMITDGANFGNPNYHEASDSPETLDYVRLKKVVEALCGTLGELAGNAKASHDCVLASGSEE